MKKSTEDQNNISPLRSLGSSIFPPALLTILTHRKKGMLAGKQLSLSPHEAFGKYKSLSEESLSNYLLVILGG